jgi:glycosyltransferase involved in cell wall biosynthesis
MVTYNQERFIGQAVESVLAQETNFAIEIVIGEDCSTDDTRSILEVLAARHPDRIRLLLADHNRGGKLNFMETFRQCRGDYVALLEGDDYWTCSMKLQKQVDALDARRDWTICYHPAEIRYDDWRQAPALWPATAQKPESTLVDLFAMDFIPTNAVVFRNRLFGDFPPWFAEITMGDWPLHILNATYGNIGFLPEVMSVYRVHSGGFWSSKSHAEQMFAVMKMLTAVDHHFGGAYAQAIDECRLNVLKYVINEAKEAKDALQQVAEFRSFHQRLLDEHRVLRDFHNEWGGSLSYRVVRETIRPFKQLRSRLRSQRARAALPAVNSEPPAALQRPPTPYPPAQAA